MDFVKSHFLQNPYFRDLYDPKIKRIFEIMQAGYKIILLLHFYPPKKALGSFQRLPGRVGSKIFKKEKDLLHDYLAGQSK